MCYGPMSVENSKNQGIMARSRLLINCANLGVDRSRSYYSHGAKQGIYYTCTACKTA